VLTTRDPAPTIKLFFTVEQVGVLGEVRVVLQGSLQREDREQPVVEREQRISRRECRGTAGSRSRKSVRRSKRRPSGPKPGKAALLRFASSPTTPAQPRF